MRSWALPGALGTLGAVAAVLWLKRQRQLRDAEKAKLVKASEAEQAAPPVPVESASPKNLSASWAARAVQAAKDAMVSAKLEDTKVAPGTLREAEDSKVTTEVIREYMVDNSLLQAQTPGLGYRRTKSSSARVDAWEPWGKVVKGVDEGDWLRVGQLFLPKTLGGIAVLHPKSTKKRVARNCTAPQYVECLMSWPTSSDLGEHATSSASSSVRSMGEASAYETPRKVPISEIRSAVAMAAACPSHGWQYLDQSGQVQGPFSLEEMTHWNKKGYFRADLLMRCHPEDSFTALAALFPAPLVPFQSHPKRPRRSLPRSHESPR